jgi:hypothetical protein
MRFVVLFLLSLGILGCGVPLKATPQPIGGSKADGTVTLLYSWSDYWVKHEVQVDWIAAQSAAEQRCRAWGYNGAERFGGGVLRQSGPCGFGQCDHNEVEVQYQCTGP